jgi:hypothetical protein
VAESAHASKAGDRGVVDDDPGALPYHYGNNPAGHQPGALEIDIEHRVPGFLGELMGQTVGADARIIEQDVDSPEPGEGLIYRPADRRIVAHITAEGQAVGSELAAGSGERFQLVP